MAKSFSRLYPKVKQNWQNMIANGNRDAMLAMGVRQAAMDMIDCAADIGAYLDDDNSEELIVAVEQVLFLIEDGFN